MPSVTLILFWAAYAGGVCTALFNPVAGVALYVLVYHVNPETQWWGNSVRLLHLRTSFTVALATGVGMLVRRPQLEHGARQFQAPYVLALLLGLLAVGSLTWGLDMSARGQMQVEKYIKLMIFLFILVRCVRKPVHYHFVIMAWMVGVMYLGYQASGGAGKSIGGRLSYGLGGPDFADSSGLSVHLVATLPLIGAAFFMARSWWGRAFTLVVGALTVNTIVMTRTRNAVVGLVAMAVVGVFSLPRGYRLKGLAAVVAGSLLAVQLTDPSWWKRMQTVTNYQNDAGALQRIEFWRAAARMASDHPFGIGLGNFRSSVQEYIPDLNMTRSAHSTYATCVAELGWPGILVFLSILGLSIRRLKRVRQAGQRMPGMHEMHFFRWRPQFHLGWHAMALRTGLVGYLACAVFTTRLFAEDLWILIGLTMCLDNVSKYMEAQELPEHPAVLRIATPSPAEVTDAPIPAPTPVRPPLLHSRGKIDHAPSN